MNAPLPAHAHSDTGLWMVGRIFGVDQVPYEVSRRDVEADSVWAEPDAIFGYTTLSNDMA